MLMSIFLKILKLILSNCKENVDEKLNHVPIFIRKIILCCLKYVFGWNRKIKILLCKNSNDFLPQRNAISKDIFDMQNSITYAHAQSNENDKTVRTDNGKKVWA